MNKQLYIHLGCCAVMLLAACNNKEKNAATEEPAAIASLYTATDKPAPTSSAPQANATKAMEIPADHNSYPQQVIHRKGYTVSYNKDTRCPNWVAWHLTKSHTYGNNQRSEQKFTEDPQVPVPRATDWDYYNSGYDRGHMCPAADNKWDAQAMQQTFLLTNICPQNHGLNKYEWNDVEMLCREWARQYGAVDIVCGPIFSKGNNPNKVGRNKVWVPDGFFKVVLRRGDTPCAIGFVYDNRGTKQPMAEHIRTVDEVERLTGIDFFPALPDNIENRVEASARLKDWTPSTPPRMK